MTEAERKAECERIAHEVKALADAYHGRLRDLAIEGYTVKVDKFQPSNTVVLVKHDVVAASDPNAWLTRFQVERDE